MHTSLFVARLLCAHGLVRTLQPSFNRTLSHPLFRLAHYGTLTSVQIRKHGSGLASARMVGADETS